MAGHYFNLYICAGAIFRSCRFIGGRCTDAGFRPLSFWLHCTIRPAYGRGRSSRRGVGLERRPWPGACIRRRSAGAWWSALEFDAAPKIIARLPFVERPDHPAALPVFVISRVAADAMATETAVWSVRVSGWGAGPARALSALADFIAVPDRAFDGAALLISLPAGKPQSISAALVKAGATVRSAALVGSHATRYTVAADKRHLIRSEHRLK